jgi:hypothetical protein
MKSGSLNPLEPSGPHRACYGTALPLPLPFYVLEFLKRPFFFLLKFHTPRNCWCRHYFCPFMITKNALIAVFLNVCFVGYYF